MRPGGVRSKCGACVHVGLELFYQNRHSNLRLRDIDRRACARHTGSVVEGFTAQGVLVLLLLILLPLLVSDSIVYTQLAIIIGITVKSLLEIKWKVPIGLLQLTEIRSNQ